MLLSLHKLLDFLAYWWHQATTSRYVLHLERENKRLLAENTALHASLAGVHGMPGRVHNQTPIVHDGPMIARQPAAAPQPIEKKERPAMRLTRRQAEANQLREHQERERERLIALQNELNEEIKAEQERANGTGYVVTEAGASPVKVEEPKVDPIEEEQQYA